MQSVVVKNPGCLSPDRPFPAFTNYQAVENLRTTKNSLMKSADPKQGI
jgi:hypothetical protein